VTTPTPFDGAIEQNRRRALARLLAVLHPSEQALREWVEPQLDASMVDQIAAADHGVDAAEHRRAIEELRRARRLPDELSWHPEEVLALTRWSTVDGSQLSLPAARRLHLMRLFCCLVLVRATTTYGSPVNSVTPLVESAVDLGPDALDAAGSYLAWCWLHEPGDWRGDPTSRPILTLALVVVSALLPAGRTPELLPGLVAAFVEELSAVLAEENLLWTRRPVHELLKLTSQAGNRRIWVSLASRCLIDGPAQRTGHGALLALLGQAVRGDLVADAAELRSLLVPVPER
jgi:hypothetical protein